MIAPDDGVVRLAGALTGAEGSALKAAALPRLRSEGGLILDLGQVTFVDSEGLSALVSLFRAAEQDGSRLALCSLPPNVRALFELTRLHRVFESYPDPRSAVAALGRSRG